MSSQSASTFEYAAARFRGALDHDDATELTRTLLEEGANPNGPVDTDSPLITAAGYGETGMARTLIAAGADLERMGNSVPGDGMADALA